MSRLFVLLIVLFPFVAQANDCVSVEKNGASPIGIFNHFVSSKIHVDWDRRTKTFEELCKYDVKELEELTKCVVEDSELKKVNKLNFSLLAKELKRKSAQLKTLCEGFHAAISDLNTDLLLITDEMTHLPLRSKQ